MYYVYQSELGKLGKRNTQGKADELSQKIYHDRFIEHYAVDILLSHAEYVTLLPKSITTAIGMGVSEELGGLVRPHSALSSGAFL